MNNPDSMGDHCDMFLIIVIIFLMFKEKYETLGEVSKKGLQRTINPSVEYLVWNVVHRCGRVKK